MCCLLATLMLIGPRAGILVWWIMDGLLWQRVYPNFIIPLLGFIFLPWTTLGYVLAMRDGSFEWFDWIIVGFAVLLDLGSLFGGYRNKEKVPYYN